MGGVVEGILRILVNGACADVDDGRGRGLNGGRFVVIVREHGVESGETEAEEGGAQDGGQPTQGGVS